MLSKNIARINILFGVGILITTFVASQIYLLYDYGISLKKLVLVSAKSADNVVLNVVFSIRNKSLVMAKLKRYNLDVYISNIKVFTASSNNSFDLKPITTTELISDVNVNLKNIFSKEFLSLITLLKGGLSPKETIKNIPYRVKGTIDISAYGISIKNMKVDYNSTLGDML